MIRVLLVDDSLFTRKIITDLLNMQSNIIVVDEAKDGEEALDKLNDSIDLVLLDIEMPKKGGLQVLEEWKRKQVRVPVIILSSFTNQKSETISKALELGAFGFVEKPTSAVMLKNIETELIEKIDTAYQQVSKKNASEKVEMLDENYSTKTSPNQVNNIILIGSSTGGPKALKEIIPMFPKETDAAIIVAQHMPVGGFIESLVESLARISNVDVVVAEHKQRINNGYVYIAPSGVQILLGKNEEIELKEIGLENGHAPSIDFLFRETLKNNKSKRIFPVVLTGMGADGSKGSLLYSQKGIETVVQSENTSVVFGMPKKVIETGAKHKVLDLKDIPDYLLSRLEMI